MYVALIDRFGSVAALRPALIALEEGVVALGGGVVEETETRVGCVVFVAYLWKGVAASAWAMVAPSERLAGCRAALVAPIGTVGATG